MAKRIEIENNCVGCDIPCMNCGRNHEEVAYYSCDKCNEELDAEDLYFDNESGEMYCEDCLKDRFPKVSDVDND